MEDDFDEEEGHQFSSRTVDVSALPSDSLVRVAEMSRARRARLLADEESWVQEGKFQDKADEYLQHELKIIAADEDTARGVAAKQEEKARDRHQRAFAEQTLHLQEDVSRFYQKQQFDTKKEAEIKRLKSELHRKAFQGFWEQERNNINANTASPQRVKKWGGGSPSDKATSCNQVTNILRVAYENSIPPFVTDPEEAWRRGVTVAPDLQRNGGHSSSRYFEADETLKQLNLPSFHEYSRDMQDKYHQWQQRQEDSARLRYEEQVKAEQDALRAQQEHQQRQLSYQQGKSRLAPGGQDFSLHPIQQRQQQQEHASQQLAYQNRAVQMQQQAQSPQRKVNYAMAFPQHFETPR